MFVQYISLCGEAEVPRFIEKERPVMLDSRRRRSPRVYRTDPYHGREERDGARVATCELLIFGQGPLFLSRGDALLWD